MAKSEERIQKIKEYILEFQFIYHRTPTMEQIAKAVGTVKAMCTNTLPKWKNEESNTQQTGNCNQRYNPSKR